MRKIFLALVATMVLSSVSANAGGKFGVTAGLGFNTSKLTEMGGDTRTGWNAGITGAFDLPLGFSIQPSLVYNAKTMDISESVII